MSSNLEWEDAVPNLSTRPKLVTEGIFRRCFPVGILVTEKGLWGLGKSLWFLYAGPLSTGGSRQTLRLIYVHSPQSAVKLGLWVERLMVWGKGWWQLGSLRCSKAMQEGLAVSMPSEICGKSVDLSFPKEWIHKKGSRGHTVSPHRSLKNRSLDLIGSPPVHGEEDTFPAFCCLVWRDKSSKSSTLYLLF